VSAGGTRKDGRHAISGAPDVSKLMATTHAHGEQVDYPRRFEPEANPVLVEHARERARSAQNRLADRITAFAGSMWFVYLSALWFGCWIGFGVEGYPYGLLTMIVSLEAIFLTTFVMISQNRTDAKRQLVADQQWKVVQIEDQQNEELLALSHQILDLTKQVHEFASTLAAASPPAPGSARPRPDQP
jgi:uncharacterized membrane protein